MPYEIWNKLYSVQKCSRSRLPPHVVCVVSTPKCWYFLPSTVNGPKARTNPGKNERKHRQALTIYNPRASNSIVKLHVKPEDE